MKKLLQNGRKQTVRNLNSLLREMKENTRFISENKNSQFANKNLVRLLTEYKKETNKYVGYSILMEVDMNFIDNESKKTVEKLKKVMPILLNTNRNNEIGRYLERMQFGLAAAAISQSDEEMEKATTAGKGSPFKAMAMDRPRTNYLSRPSSLVEQLQGSEDPQQLIDIVSETIGKATGFIRGFLSLFGNEENLQKLKDLVSGKKKQGLFSRLVSRGPDSELISMVKKAFSDLPGFDVDYFAKELKGTPQIITDNEGIAGEVFSIASSIPKLDKEYRDKVKIGLGSRIASLLTSPNSSGAGGLFGRAPLREE
jgi:hypothetical protein